MLGMEIDRLHKVVDYYAEMEDKIREKVSQKIKKL
jgi:hypothetical protein